jgi:hypothetical protein
MYEVRSIRRHKIVWGLFLYVKKIPNPFWGHFTQIIRRGLGVRGSHYFKINPGTQNNPWERKIIHTQLL